MDNFSYLVCKIVKSQIDGENRLFDVPFRVFRNYQSLCDFMKSSPSSTEFSVFTIDESGCLTCVKGPNMLYN